eukprot:403374854
MDDYTEQCFKCGRSGFRNKYTVAFHRKNYCDGRSQSYYSESEEEQSESEEEVVPQQVKYKQVKQKVKQQVKTKVKQKVKAKVETKVQADVKSEVKVQNVYHVTITYNNSNKLSNNGFKEGKSAGQQGYRRR